jgi:HCOMODA/2-hydroxy-3-carboxy-muconic semialdehyde decarboxylase
MSMLDYVLDELVTANRILAREGVVDSFGHVSARHPDNPDHFLMSRARAPELVEADDIMEFTLTGEPVNPKGRKPYLERYIHGGIFEARPDVQAVVHNHSPSVIPFGATGIPIRPIMHMIASVGHKVPLWDSQAKFGDTNLLVSDVAMGRDLAQAVGAGPTALMRGHGCVTAGKTIRQAVYIAVYLELGAKLQMQAMQLGDPTFLTDGEVDLIISRTGPYTINRAWENWCRRAGRVPQEEATE